MWVRLPPELLRLFSSMDEHLTTNQEAASSSLARVTIRGALSPRTPYRDGESKMPLYGEAKRKYDREYLATRRASWFKGKVCAHCGTDKRLELNHKDPSTKVSHRIWSWSEVRRLEELAKCEPLCYTCHKEVTRQQFSKPIMHGTYQGYRKGCKEECCMEAMRQHWRDRRNPA